MKTIPLTQGQVALVDDSDYEALSAFKWYAWRDCQTRTFYARRNTRQEGKRLTLYMHKAVLPAEGEIDHIDGNGLNNQRNNLRPSTHMENMQGFQRKKSRTSSVYRGVSWYSRGRTWQAEIKINKKRAYLGHFSSEEAAGHAYDTAAKEHFGDRAHLNFP